ADHETDVHSHHDVLMNRISWKEHWNLLVALFILIVMLVLKHGFGIVPENKIDFSIHAIAFILAGYNVVRLAFRNIKTGNIFNEFVLMSVATLGAFYIGAYSEGVAVMVFYCIGEWFQDSAVQKAKRNIKALLDIRPDEATVVRNGRQEMIHPSKINLDETILVRSGEKVALDGELISENASFNTAALTGESNPVSKHKADLIYAGMINLDRVAEIKVKASFKDSALSRILEMVQDASARKSQTQLFISRFAKIYTPIVFFLALALCLVPYFFVDVYNFDEWFYRSLVFLVVSCPCALVISIPLGYFGGIGLASRNGILFKGGNFLDAITKVNTVVMDKTGTLTKGVFKVQNVSTETLSKEELIMLTTALEKHSTHPVAKAIIDFTENKTDSLQVKEVEEIAGMGLKGNVDGKELLAGNLKLLEKFQIPFPQKLKQEIDTIVVVAINNIYEGYIVIADEIKEDAVKAIHELQRMNITTIMLSGDRESVAHKVAAQLGIKEAYGDLLPERKLERVQLLKNAGKRIAFAGDGVNDAPVIALADVGIAMGALGSHATIETADVVIQNDQPLKIVSAIKIGKITRNIVWQNISIAMIVKLAVLILGAEGIATLWEAVIADVGVALLAILNAVRIQRIRF
ncbi:MAG TPA: heavy metal translocating P-type ATPase, partial [Hanamia sp.]|nr:heavy metal translocating P-type ATPase [Hanamia sp.]